MSRRSRNPDTANGLPDQVQIERWDARTSVGWGGLADGALAIVNLAGENLAGEGFLPSRWTDERKARLRDSRINAGKAVVEAVERAKVKPGVVIQSSGIGHYGFREGQAADRGGPCGKRLPCQADGRLGGQHGRGDQPRRAARLRALGRGVEARKKAR